jgi:glutamate formiminotransferase/glutamate formiminotransferase/formiminotetrahydrofolate cyclodeaminase
MDRPLLAVPNVSTGNPELAARLAGAFSRAGTKLLDVHSDLDHGRSVLSAAGSPGPLVDALVVLASRACAEIDVLAATAGQHPHVGSLDVAPFVYVDESQRGAACAAALTLGARIGELGIPAFLYGELTGDGQRPPRTRSQLRAGGVTRLAERIASGELSPDYGPAAIHQSAGAVLVAARRPLVAFNVVLAEGDLLRAREVASLVREGGRHGLPGLRAIGVLLAGQQAQVSMNVERPTDPTLAEVVAAISELAPVQSAEIVGLVPAAALEGFPDSLPIDGFDPSRQVLENALGSC